MNERRRELIRNKVLRDRVIEQCVQAALDYRDEEDAHLATLDPDGKMSDGSYIVGDPHRTMGASWGANAVALRLRRMKMSKHLH